MPHLAFDLLEKLSRESLPRRTNDKFAQTVTSCLCSTGLFLARGDELFAGKWRREWEKKKKVWKAVRERSESTEREGLQKCAFYY